MGTWIVGVILTLSCKASYCVGEFLDSKTNIILFINPVRQDIGRAFILLSCGPQSLLSQQETLFCFSRREAPEIALDNQEISKYKYLYLR